MQTYTVWKNNYTGINEKCLMNEDGNYIGIKTGDKYLKSEHYHSQQLKAQIISVDESNQTGMIHLYKEANEIGENKKSWKEQYIGCYITVEKAHWCGDIQVYRCLELGDYWSSNEIKILE
jgi:hypothetical protein